MHILDEARIDNFPSRLHYKFTSGFMFMATALLAVNDMFGKVVIQSSDLRFQQTSESIVYRHFCQK